MQLDFEVSAADLDLGHRRASRLIAESVRKDVAVRVLRFVYSVAFVLFVATAVVFVAEGGKISATALRWLLLCAAICIVALAGYSMAVRRRLRLLRRSRLAPLPALVRVAVTDDGCEFSDKTGRDFVPWSRFRRLTPLSGHLALEFDAKAAVIPLSAFPSDEARQAFEAEVRRHAGS